MPLHEMTARKPKPDVPYARVCCGMHYGEVLTACEHFGIRPYEVGLVAPAGDKYGLSTEGLERWKGLVKRT